EINEVLGGNSKKERGLGDIKSKEDEERYIIKKEGNGRTEEKEGALETLSEAVRSANDEINGGSRNGQVERGVENGETNIGNVVRE
ncbi:DUF1542 domain-containing protein, partial [Staphylococcus warneri]|uniref:DUF1542 domain-containing protein n=1 Tax=Staphylococcus warneri TaxID=1292 RepID=UPI0011A3AB1E